ncbi:MAG: HEAT repeat domain-containing protein [Planctomycetota bacterium]|jgi:hypothetical protein
MTRKRRLVGAALVTVLGALLAASAPAAEKEEKSPGELLRIAEQSGLKESFEAFGKLATIRDRESLRQWKVIDGLSGLARHPNPRKARRALEALYSLYRFDKTIKYDVLKSVAGVLQDKDGHSIVRIKAAEVLGNTCVAKELQDQNALDTMIRAARPSDTTPPEVAKACIVALGEIGDPRARSVVRDSLSYTNVNDKDAQADIRDAAIEALGTALRGSHAKEWVDQALGGRISLLLTDKDQTAETRAKVHKLAVAFTKTGGTVRNLEGTLLTTLEEATEPDAVIMALESFAGTGNEKAVAAFFAVLGRFKKAGQDDQGARRVRGAVCAATGKLLTIWSNAKTVPKKGVVEAVDLLITGMLDADNTVREQAVINIGNLYDTRCDRRKAAKALVAIATAKGMSEETKKNAIDSLEAVSGRVLGDDPSRWEAWISKRMNLDSLGPKTRRGRR